MPQPQDCWLGFDLGGTKMLAQVYDSSFQLLGKARKKTRPTQGQEAGVKRILDTAREAIDDAKISTARIRGIGVGCAGPLDLEKGILLDPPNLGWKNVALKDAMETEFGAPAIISNDVDAGVYGEYRFGAGRGARCVVGIFPGTGIGGGCVYEGQIFRGRTRSCLEIGHIPIVADGPLCGCGKRGCLEAVAGRLTIAAMAAKAAYRGDAPHLMEIAGTDIERIRSGALAEAIKKGDKVIEEIVREAAQNIGLATAAIVNLLAPEVVVLGGGLVEAMRDIFVTEVTRTARDRVMSPFVDIFRVVPSQLADDATAKGAAAWAEASLQRASESPR